MAKLQQVIRKDGSSVNSVNIPIDMINRLLWRKGTKLSFTVEQLSIDSEMVLIISRSEE